MNDIEIKKQALAKATLSQEQVNGIADKALKLRNKLRATHSLELELNLKSEMDLRKELNKFSDALNEEYSEMLNQNKWLDIRDYEGEDSLALAKWENQIKMYEDSKNESDKEKSEFLKFLVMPTEEEYIIALQLRAWHRSNYWVSPV
jgi:hypothetical protein